MSKHHGLYKFVTCDTNEIIYIGKTNNNLKSRVADHIRGKGIDEKGYDKKTGKMLVCVNKAWFRPTDVVNLLGDPTKAKRELGWNPQKTSYEELCKIMAEHDLELANRELALKNAKYIGDL